MTKAEKITILASLGSAALFSTFYLMKPYLPQFQEGESLVQKRKRIIQDENMRVLYSSMSFLYLQGYEPSAKNLFLLKDVLDIAKPKYVALQLAEADYIEQYLPIIQNAQFYEIMKRVDYLIKTQNAEELMKIRELDMTRGIENLYILNYCRQNGCKVILFNTIIIYADEPFNTYERILDAKLKLRQMKEQGGLQIPDNLQKLYSEAEINELNLNEDQINKEVWIKRRSENYVDYVMKELKPKFSLVPDTPYKVIVGVVSKDNSDEVARLWKQKFQSVYGHQIIEDERVESKQE